MAGFFEFYHKSRVMHVYMHTTESRHMSENYPQLLAGCLSLSTMMYLCSKRNYQLKYKQNSSIFERKVLPGYVINPQ